MQIIHWNCKKKHILALEIHCFNMEIKKLTGFKIEKLFGFQDLDLHFEKDVLILMGENGLGKTSILNSLYFTLTQKWQKLLKINFKSITITFEHHTFSFTKTQLNLYTDLSLTQRPSRFLNLKEEIQQHLEIDELVRYLEENKESNKDRHRLIYDVIIKKKGLNKILEAPSGLLIDLTEQILKLQDAQNIQKFIDFLNVEPTYNILYFPTYRRVEEELHNLGRLRRVQHDDLHYLWDDSEKEETDELEEETLIQFGMEDVENRIRMIIAKINESSVKGFAKVTGEMLHQLQEGFPSLTREEILAINKNNIEIILNRVKNNLSRADRDNIIRLLESKELLNKPELAYFLLKLQDIYLQQRELDNSIKEFERICNEYLVGKGFIFDESSVTLAVFNEKTGERVELNQLSSGEKQIVSLFSKIYLEDLNNLMIFFDEPELSLSIKWQKQLLPHILSSNKCNFLLAVTHSPFIFSNELENCAIGINTFID